MAEKKKKTFVKPMLIKFDKPLNEVTLCGCGSPPDCCGSKTWSFFDWWR